MKIENIEKAKNEDKEEFNNLINEIKFKLYKTGIAILKNDDDTCDAIQETIISIYKNLNQLENKENFTTWSIRIMINKCYDIIKKNKKIIPINIDESLSGEVYYDNYCEESLLQNTINKIEKDLKMVVILYYYDDISVKDIAKILNIPEGTIKSRLSRARKVIYDDLIKERGE